MAAEAKSRFWRKCRVCFRWCRITVLFVILMLLGAAIYLNQTGLPDFIKRPLLDELHGRGVTLEFSRLRWRWFRGVVAENVRFGVAEDPTVPRLSADEVELDINHDALLHRRWQVDALGLHKGRLEWVIPPAHTPTPSLTVSNIEARLRLLPGDEWALDELHARFAGAQFTVSGAVTNATAVRNWNVLRGQPSTRINWPDRLRRLADTLERVAFSKPPELRLQFDGDAREPQSFNARFDLRATDADTPWGRATNVAFGVRLFAATSNQLSRAELNLKSGDAQTPWANATRLEVELQAFSLASQTNLVDASLNVQAETAETQWASVTNAQFTAHWIHSITNAIPLSGEGGFHAASATTRWASGRNLRLTFTGAVAPNVPPADATWGAWTNLQPYQLTWAAGAGELQSEQLTAQNIDCAGAWHAPALAITNLHIGLRDGAVNASAQVDVATRKAGFDLASDFDLHQIAPLLPENARRWLEKFSWTTPPHLRGSVGMTLPAWVNRPPEWRTEFLPTLRLAGEFAVTNGAYLGLHADWIRTQLACTNRVWQLPDFELHQPDGALRLALTADENTGDYHARIHSTVDPRAVRPLLSTNQQDVFDLVTLNQPPLVDGELWGRRDDFDRIGFRGRVAVTNFAFREQTADYVTAGLDYTNRVLTVITPRLGRGPGPQVLTASGLALDFNSLRLYITNGFSTADPRAVVRAIGPETAKVMEPYYFAAPPTVHVEGFVPLHDPSNVDVRFTLTGGPFAWWKFKLPKVSSLVHWSGDTLTLTNIQADFYEGEAAGFAHFNFLPSGEADYSFDMTTTNANLRLLMEDLFPHTSALEGRLGGQLVVTAANSADINSWRGYGQAQLRDGLIWAIPIFGVFSKPLDALVPGLGNSRVSDGTATFVITNGVIFSDDLVMRAPTMRLKYQGTTDFAGRVDARVEASLLRDAWVVGRLVSLALWPLTKMMEYKVTGTLDHPKTEPIYIPKLLLAPLHPFRTLEELLTVETPATNAPPMFKSP